MCVELFDFNSKYQVIKTHSFDWNLFEDVGMIGSILSFLMQKLTKKLAS